MADDKINDRLKTLLGAAPDMAMNMGKGMNPMKAGLATIGGMMQQTILGPAAGLAGIFLGVSRTLTSIIRQTDQWGRGIAQMRTIESLQSKFEVILKSTALAKERMKELASMSVRTPFNLQELAGASRNLELLTKGAYASRAALTAVGDAAAATGADIQDVSFTVGKLYNFLQNGRSIQNLAFQLQNMGVISGELQNRLEMMQASGAGFSQMWGEVTNELNRTRGAMASEMETLAGLTKRLEGARDAMARGFGENFVDQEKTAIYATLKATEALSPVLKLIGRDVSTVTSAWGMFTSNLKGSVAETVGASGALTALWKTFVAVGTGIASVVAVNVGGFIGGIGKKARGVRDNIASGAAAAGPQAWAERLTGHRDAAATSFGSARDSLLRGAYTDAGMSAAQGAYHKGAQYVSRLGVAGSSAAAGARASALAANAAIEAAALRRVGTSAATAAVGLTVLGDVKTKLVAGSKALLGMLSSVVTSIPGWGWAVAAVVAAGVGIAYMARSASDARARVNEMTKALQANREALLRQATAIVTAEQRTSALAKAYEVLSDAQTRMANAPTAKERAVAAKAVEEAKGDIKTIGKRKVGRALNDDDLQLGAERRYYERYEQPVAELEAQAEGSSPVKRAAIAAEIARRRRAQQKEAQDRIDKQTAFEGSDAGREYATAISERNNIAGAKDAAEAIIEQQKIVDAADAKFPERSSFGSGFGLDAGVNPLTSEERATQRERDAAQKEIKRLRRFEKPEFAQEFEGYKKARINTLNTRIDELAPDAETTGRVKALTKDIETNPNLTDDQRLAKVNERDQLQMDLRATNLNAQQFRGAGGSKAVDDADRAAKYADLSAKSFLAQLAVEKAIMNVRSVGYRQAIEEQQARIDGAKEELALTKERAKLEGDSTAVEQAEMVVEKERRALALLKERNRETQREAKANIDKATRGNDREIAGLTGDKERAAQIDFEDQTQQHIDELSKVRADAIANGGDPEAAMENYRQQKFQERRSQLIAAKKTEIEQGISGSYNRAFLQKGWDFKQMTDSGMSEDVAIKRLGGNASEIRSAAGQVEQKFGLSGGAGGLYDAINSQAFQGYTDLSGSRQTPEELAKRSQGTLGGVKESAAASPMAAVAKATTESATFLKSIDASIKAAFPLKMQ